MRRVTNREAVCGTVIHSIFDVWHYDVLWTCAQMRTVLYQLYTMTRNCTRFHVSRDCHRPGAWGQVFLTCNAMEHGRAGGMMPLAKYFLHIELRIVGEPGLMTRVKYFLHIKLWIVGELGLMPLVRYCLHIELWIKGRSEASYLRYDLYWWSHEMWEGRRKRTPDTLWRPYCLLLLMDVLLVDYLLLRVLVRFVLVNNSISVPVVFLQPSSIKVSLHVSFSLRWFGPEMI